MIPRILLATVLCLAGAGLQAAVDTSTAVLWPEHQRTFIQDAPSLLLTDEQKREFLQSTAEVRDQFVENFLGEDPIPETEENELAIGIERRLALVRHEEYLSFVDSRARVLFLNGPPAHREIVDCGQVFVPIEVWFYGPEGARFPLIMYQATPESGYRAWFPTDSKRVLFNEEMEYFVEQLEELGMMSRGGKWLRKVCPDVKRVDEATGVEGLRGFQKNRPTDQQVWAFLLPPVDLGIWSRSAAATEQPADLEQIELSDLEVLFPEKLRQRMIARFFVSIPSVAGLDVSTAEDEPGLALAVDGEIVQDGQVFERFRVRFKLEPPAEDLPVALVV